MSAVFLALNEGGGGGGGGAERDNQTVASFCVIGLKGDLGQSRHSRKRGEPGRRANSVC